MRSKLILVFCISVFVYTLASAALADSAADVITTKSDFEMVLVKAGEFQMGSDNLRDHEAPAHRVKITYDYYIGRYEVTYELYDRYCTETKTNKATPNIKERGQRPVMGVHWIDALKFCNWLSTQEGLTPCYGIRGNITTCDFKANGYRLPTEAEWEYAAKGGHKGKGHTFSGSNEPDAVAWYGHNSGGDFKRVGLKKPNELGIYDMSGNMWEWCWDWYDPTYYQHSPLIDPRGPEIMPKQDTIYDPERSRRSGRWLNEPVSITVSSRSADFVRYRGDNGIRLVRTR